MLVSKYMQYLELSNTSSVMWHSIFGRVMQVPQNVTDYLMKLKNNSFTNSLIEQHFGKDAYTILKESHIIIDSVDQEQQDIDTLFLKHNESNKNKIKYLSLIMSEECPFRCTYCIHFANSKHYFNKEKMMSFEIAKKSIDDYLDLMIKKNESDFYINFGGGEPLLNYGTIAKLLPYIQECEKEYGITIRTGINTNLSLLNIEIAKTLTKYGVAIATSLDGTKTGNDKVRLTKNLTGTYDRIINGMKLLEELGNPVDGFAMTVTEANITDVNEEIIDWAESKGMKEVRIDIDVVGIVSVSIDEIIERLINVRKYAAEKGISVIGFWSRPAENLGLIPERDDIGFCGGERGNSICVAPNGQVFPCGYSNYQLGNYNEISVMYQKNPYKALLEKRNLMTQPMKCRNCSIFGFCRGGCLITKEANHGTNEKQLAMCELYVGMTEAIIRECATT